MLETLGSGIVYTWIRNVLPRIIKGIPGIWNGISWIGNGIYRVQEWYIQGSGMVYTGIRNGIYRDQEWYAPENSDLQAGIWFGNVAPSPIITIFQ